MCETLYIYLYKVIMRIHDLVYVKSFASDGNLIDCVSFIFLCEDIP